MPLVEHIDIDALLNKWAELWIETSNSKIRKDWYDVTGEKKEVKDNISFKERVLKDYPNLAWPPRVEVACLENNSEFSIEKKSTQTPTVNIKDLLKSAEPEILFSYEISNQDDLKPIAGKDNIFSYSKKVSKSLKVTTNRSYNFKINAAFSILGSGVTPEFSFSLVKSHEELKGEEITIGQTITKQPDHVLVLEATKLDCIIKRKIVLSGYLVVAGNKPFSPNLEYTKNVGSSHKKWVIPITKVFDDLKKYSQLDTFPENLKRQLDAFEIDTVNHQIISMIDCRCEISNSFQLVSKLKQEIQQQFEKQIEFYKAVLIEHNQNHHQVERLFCEGVPLKKYYSELTILSGEDFQARERELKKQEKINALDNDEIYLTYHQMTDEISTNVKYQNLLPSAKQDKWQVLITGTAGVGKTTLSKKLCSESNSWCFYIPIRNLTTDRYPVRANKPYTLAEILISEGFPAFLRERLLPLPENSLWEKYLTQSIISTNMIVENQPVFQLPSMLVILDGYDEKEIPTHLEPVFKQLMQSRQLVLTSRPYNLSGLREDYHFKQDKWLEVTGFSAATLRQYIYDFFNSVSLGPQSIKEFIAHLEKTPYILGACRIPVNCEMACTAWMSGTFDQEVLTMSGLYNALLVSLSKRYVKKFSSLTQEKSFEDMDDQEVLEDCQYSIAFTEYFAFDSLVQRKLFLNPVAAKNHLPIDKRSSAVLQQKQLGFIKPSSDHGHTGGGTFYFSHLTFRDYFAARYIATALQKASGSNKCVSSYFTEFNVVDNGENKNITIQQFIQEKKFEPSFEHVIWFIVGLLTEVKDVVALEYFYQLLLNEPHDLVGFYTTLLLVRCLDESQSILPNMNEKIKSQLFELIQSWIIYSLKLYKNQSYKKTIYPLWERLKLSKNLLRQNEIIQFIKQIITTADGDDLSIIIDFFEITRFFEVEVIAHLLEVLSKLPNDNEELYYKLISACFLANEDVLVLLNNAQIDFKSNDTYQKLQQQIQVVIFQFLATSVASFESFNEFLNQQRTQLIFELAIKKNIPQHKEIIHVIYMSAWRNFLITKYSKNNTDINEPILFKNVLQDIQTVYSISNTNHFIESFYANPNPTQIEMGSILQIAEMSFVGAIQAIMSRHPLFADEESLAEFYQFSDLVIFLKTLLLHSEHSSEQIRLLVLKELKNFLLNTYFSNILIKKKTVCSLEISIFRKIFASPILQDIEKALKKLGEDPVEAIRAEVTRTILELSPSLVQFTQLTSFPTALESELYELPLYNFPLYYLDFIKKDHSELVKIAFIEVYFKIFLFSYDRNSHLLSLASIIKNLDKNPIYNTCLKLLTTLSEDSSEVVKAKLACEIASFSSMVKNLWEHLLLNNISKQDFTEIYESSLIQEPIKILMHLSKDTSELVRTEVIKSMARFVIIPIVSQNSAAMHFKDHIIPLFQLESVKLFSENMIRLLNDNSEQIQQASALALINGLNFISIFPEVNQHITNSPGVNHVILISPWVRMIIDSLLNLTQKSHATLHATAMTIAASENLTWLRAMVKTEVSIQKFLENMNDYFQKKIILEEDNEEKCKQNVVIFFTFIKNFPEIAVNSESLLLNLLTKPHLKSFYIDIAIALIVINSYKGSLKKETINKLLKINDASEAKIAAQIDYWKNNIKDFSNELGDFIYSGKINQFLLSALFCNTPQRRIISHLLKLTNSSARINILTYLVNESVNEGKAFYLKDRFFYFYENKKYSKLPLHEKVTEKEFSNDLAFVLKELNIFLLSSLSKTIIALPVESELQKKRNEALKTENQALQRRVSTLEKHIVTPPVDFIPLKLEADRLYAEGRTAYYSNESSKAITFFGNARTQYKQLLKVSTFEDPEMRKKAEKRINKTSGEDSKYSPAQLMKLSAL